MEVAKTTEATIARAREIYRSIAERGSLMFFLIDQLHVISHMYQVGTLLTYCSSLTCANTLLV